MHLDFSGQKKSTVSSKQQIFVSVNPALLHSEQVRGQRVILKLIYEMMFHILIFMKRMMFHILILNTSFSLSAQRGKVVQLWRGPRCDTLKPFLVIFQLIRMIILF